MSDCKPINTTQRRCGTHHNLPLYPNGMCIEGIKQTGEHREALLARMGRVDLITLILELEDLLRASAIGMQNKDGRIRYLETELNCDCGRPHQEFCGAR